MLLYNYQVLLLSQMSVIWRHAWYKTESNSNSRHNTHSSSQHIVQQRSQTPPIHGFVMTSPCQNFRSPKWPMDHINFFVHLVPLVSIKFQLWYFDQWCFVILHVFHRATERVSNIAFFDFFLAKSKISEFDVTLTI